MTTNLWKNIQQQLTPDLPVREVTNPVKGASLLKQWRWPVLAVLVGGLVYFLGQL